LPVEDEPDPAEPEPDGARFCWLGLEVAPEPAEPLELEPVADEPLPLVAPLPALPAGRSQP
jgi:hypothetical protein